MFLDSLIERHRGDGAMVQPRPRSRFEQETGFLKRDSELFRAQVDESQENVKGEDTKDASFQNKPYATRNLEDPISPHQRSPLEQGTSLFPAEAKPSRMQPDMGQDNLKNKDIKDASLHQRFLVSESQGDPVSSRLFTAENQDASMHELQSRSIYGKQSKTDKAISQLRDDLDRTLDRVQTSNESFLLNPGITSIVDNRAQQENTNARPNSETASDPIGEQSFQSEFSQRAHLLLQRLQPQVEPSRARETDSNRLARMPASEITQPLIIKSGEEASLSPSVEQEPVRPLDSSRFNNKPIEEHELSRASLEVGGALQIPAWLSDMQTDFNNRLKEMNAKSEAESVVNVTIGRVEIRAVQAEPVRQPKLQKKSVGVMSLDDYLQQRVYGGQR